MHLPITYFNPNETDQETTKIVFFDSTSDDIMKARKGIGCWRKHLKAEGGSVHFSHIKTSMKETAHPDDLKGFQERSRTMDAQLANSKVSCIIEDPDLTELFITKTANDTVYQLPFIEKFCGIFRLKAFPDRPKPPLSKISVLLYLVNNTVDYVDVNVEWKNKQGEPLLQMGPLRLNNNVDNAIPGFALRSAQEHMDLMNTVLFDVFYSKIERHTWHSDSIETCALKSVPSKNTP